MIEKLREIERQLEEVIASDEGKALLQSHYQPDVTLPDALQGVRQAIFFLETRSRRIPYTTTFIEPGAIA